MFNRPVEVAFRKEPWGVEPFGIPTLLQFAVVACYVEPPIIGQRAFHVRVIVSAPVQTRLKGVDETKSTHAICRSCCSSYFKMEIPWMISFASLTFSALVSRKAVRVMSSMAPVCAERQLQGYLPPSLRSIGGLTKITGHRSLADTKPKDDGSPVLDCAELQLTGFLEEGAWGNAAYEHRTIRIPCRTAYCESQLETTRIRRRSIVDWKKF